MKKVLDEILLPGEQHLPQSVNWYTKGLVLFGTPNYQVYFWMLLIPGMIFLYFFDTFGNAADSLRSIGEWDKTTATISQVGPSRQESISDNDDQIIRMDYEYVVDGKLYYNHSFTYGIQFVEGAVVDLDYKKANPKFSKLTGARTRPYDYTTSFAISFFSLLGIVLLFVSAFKNRKAVRLLNNGLFSQGFRKKRTSSLDSSDLAVYTPVVYKDTYTYDVKGRSYTVTSKTEKEEQLKDEEVILYHSENPENCVVYNAFRNMPSINANGRIRSHVFPYKFYIFGAPLLSLFVLLILLLLFITN